MALRDGAPDELIKFLIDRGAVVTEGLLDYARSPELREYLSKHL